MGLILLRDILRLLKTLYAVIYMSLLRSSFIIVIIDKVEEVSYVSSHVSHSPVSSDEFELFLLWYFQEGNPRFL